MSASVLPNDPTVQPSDVTSEASTESTDAILDQELAVDAPVADVPTVVVPDRADAPISEITERFFRALLLKVPLDRIEELHLFSPLRQGGVETGIAVIAAREEIMPEVPAAELEEAPAELPLQLEGESVNVVEAVGDVESVAAAVGEAGDAVESTEAVKVVDAAGSGEAVNLESPYADDIVEAEPVLVAPIVVPKVRHTVYTARYRLVQKGPERGKWEADVVAEAEAPLITVETVVRGVLRRAGEESDTTRFSAAQIARALRLQLGAA